MKQHLRTRWAILPVFRQVFGLVMGLVMGFVASSFAEEVALPPETLLKETLPSEALPKEASPGELVHIQLPPASRVKLAHSDVAATVYTSPTGAVLLGLGWNAKGSIALVVDGKPHSLRVKPRQYKIERIKGLPARKVTPDPADIAQITADNRLIKATRKLFIEDIPSLNWLMPAKGRISGVFGSRRELNGKMRSPHKGLDIAAPAGTPIIAPLAGKVVLAKAGMFYTGNTMVLAHGGGLTTIYAHLKAMEAKVGDWVEAGEVIATVGSTGRSTAPHLHWGVYLNKIALDPQMLGAKQPK